MAPVRSRLRSLFAPFSPASDQEFGCQRRRGPGGFRCPNTYLSRAARAAGHDGYCSPECADAQLGDQRGDPFGAQLA